MDWNITIEKVAYIKTVLVFLGEKCI